MTTCQIDVNAYFASLSNPGTTENFVRPNYGDPAGPPVVTSYDLGDTPWSIKIFYNGTAYEFSWFYVGQTMRIHKIFSQRGSFGFHIADDDEYDQMVPFRPVEEMPVEIWAGSHQYASGYISDVDSIYKSQRADLSDAAVYVISCTDLYQELELEPVLETYTGKRLGFILKDVLTRYTTLDASDIDPLLGFEVQSFPINEKLPSQVLNHIADILGMTYWIESSTRKVKLTTKDSNGTRFDTQFTDANIYDYFDCDTFSLRKETDKIKTAIKLRYRSRYSAGTVNVAQNSNIVAAFGGSPETQWDGLPAGLEFKLADSDAVYTVEENLSSGATQELRLSSDYKESTDTDQAYELRGNYTYAYVSDEAAALSIKAIRGGGTGIRTYTVSVDDNFFTSYEAFQFAQSLLALSKPLPKGRGTTFNSVFKELPLEAGRSMSFDLERTRRFVGDVAVQEFIITDLGGTTQINGETHPFCQIDCVFTSVMTSDQAQWRKIMQDLRKVQVGLGGDDDVVRHIRISDTLLLKDCIHVDDPVPITDTLTLDDEISTRSIDTGRVLFYTELDYTHDPWSHSITSD